MIMPGKWHFFSGATHTMIDAPIIRINSCVVNRICAIWFYDNAHEHIDPGIRMGDSTVMLSAAKHLGAQRDHLSYAWSR
jgi:hypothetical protein